MREGNMNPGASSLCVFFLDRSGVDGAGLFVICDASVARQGD